MPSWGIKALRRFGCVMACCFATQGMADSQDELAHQVEQAATHEGKGERHTAEIDGCQMTTFRWRDIPDQGWVLWTSFRFDMVDAPLNVETNGSGQNYTYAKLGEGPPEVGFGMIAFTMRAGKLARQERSVLREPSLETTPSPRGDGTTHYFEYREEFFFNMHGVGVERKVQTFARTYERYVAEHCTFSS